MAKKKKKKKKKLASTPPPILPSISKLKRLENQISSIFTIFSRLFILTVGLTAFYLIYKGLTNNSYVIQPFQVPKTFEQSGHNGLICSRKIQDKVKELKLDINSTKTDSIQFKSNDKPDLEVDVVGFGLSLNSLTYHLRTLLGRKNYAIMGEITDYKEEMTLTMRMTGYDSKSYTKSYTSNREEAFDYLIEEGAKYIIYNTDPYRIAVYQYNKKEYAQSLRIITKMIENKRELPWAYLAWGNLLSKQGEKAEAIKKFEKAIEIDPSFHKVLSNIAWTSMQNQQYTKSQATFERLLKLDHKNLEYLNGLAMSYRNLDQNKAAMETYDKLITYAPDKLWGYASKADMLFNEYDTLGASALFRLAATKVKDGPEKYMALGGFYTTIGKVDSALYYGNKILEIMPDNSLAINQIIRLSYRAKKYKSALAYIANVQQIKEHGGGDKIYHKQSSFNLLAMASYQLKDYKGALALVQEAIDVDPSASYPYTTLAEIYGFMGKTDAFYLALGQALQRGFPLEQLLEDEPYKHFVPQKRFQAIIQKYKAKKKEIALVN